MSEGMDRPLELENPFWRFSLAVYAMSGVQEECLFLQNSSGVNVNLLLYCAWRGTEGDCLTDAALKRSIAAVQGWHDEIITPLRAARTHLKRSGAMDAAGPEIRALRSKILEAELLGEQVEQAFLYREAASDFKPGESRGAALDANLALYLGVHGRTLNDAPMLRSHAASLMRK